ncbi:hypothetical protein BDW75DRAFT_219118 [Aspergillus navahoensis]
MAPGFCPFCLGDHTKEPDLRFQQWRTKATLISHINGHLGTIDQQDQVFCPHPCCKNKCYSSIPQLREHFYNAHSIEEPRRKCTSAKRKWITDEDDMEDSKKPKVTEQK